MILTQEAPRVWEFESRSEVQQYSRVSLADGVEDQ